MSQISVTYTGDGTSVIFTIPFPYINQSDVQVLVNGSQVTAFTFVNATTIQFNVAPANGATIEIRRSTAADISNQFFANSSIRSQSLNENFQQALFVAEEAREIAADAQTGNLVPGSIGTAVLADGAVTNVKVSNTAAIVDTKLATIATAGKVSNSATTADSTNTASAIVARDGSGNFSAGTITANLAGNASTVTTNANLTGDVTSVGNATSIAPGVIVNADISASASIAGTKVSPDFGSQNVVTTGDVRSTSINGGPLAGFRNAIINGNFDIWQRGTSSGSFGYQTVDRWSNSFIGSSNTVSRQAFALGQTDVPGEPVFFCRNTVSSVAGASNTSRLIQRVEGVRSFAGQQITISLWAKADAARPIALALNQAFGTGGSPSTLVENHVGKSTLSTSWQRFTYTVSVPSISGKTIGSDGNDNLSFVIFFDAGSSFNTATDSLGQQSGTFDIAQVQVEPGPVATPFERRPIGTELALCQRYFEISAFNRSIFSGNVTNGGGYRTNVAFQVAKLTTPTITLTNAENSNFSTAVGSVAAITQGFAENRTANGTGVGIYISNWTASAEL